MAIKVLGLDIGGANIKAAHSDGSARLQPFELWREPAGLGTTLHHLVKSFPPFQLLAVTMTGELCDCFNTKREGVESILNAVEAVASRIPVRVWQTDGRFVDPETARLTPHKTAAANWLALATLAAGICAPDSGLLIDIGSTTTDIVPLLDGKPMPVGRTDGDRLRARELVYTGVRRTPLCALIPDPCANEFFATTLDAYLILGQIAENENDYATADGRPATRVHAYGRLARMLCGDSETCSDHQVHNLALTSHRRQLQVIHNALKHISARLSARPATFVLAGSGEFLARALIADLSELSNISIISMQDRFGVAVSTAACAFSLTVLAQD